MDFSQQSLKHQTNRDLPPLVRRSTLIVPANVERYIEKAGIAGADAVNLDLEDGVPFGKKDTARERLREAIGYISGSGSDVLVRINSQFELAIEDLDACVCTDLTGVILPKVNQAVDVHIIDRLIQERETKRGLPVGQIEIGILIESPIGLMNALEIALSSPRIRTMNLGTEDFALQTGVDPSSTYGTLFAKSQIVLVANIAGLLPLGLLTSMADFKDLKALAENARLSYQVGFRGASCIHPNQIAVLNECFSPRPEEVAWAERVYEKFRSASDSGRGAVAVDDKMVDEPIVRRATDILERFKAIEEKKN